MIIAPGLESTLAGYGHAVQHCTVHFPQPHLIYGAFLLIHLYHSSTVEGKVKKGMSKKEHGRERVKWGVTSSMGVESVLQRRKVSRDLLHNLVHIVNSTVLYT